MRKHTLTTFGASLLLAGAMSPTASGAIIYATQWGRGIFSIDVDSQVVTQISVVADAWSLAASDDPDVLYVSSHSSNLRAFSISTGVYTPLAAAFGTNSLGWGYDGLLYSGQFGSPLLTVVDPATGAVSVAGAGSITGFAGDIVAAPDGDLFGLTKDNEIVRIKKSDGSTTVMSVVDPSVAGWGIATTYDGRYWLTSATSLYKLNILTGDTTFVMDTGVTAYDLASAPGETFQTMTIPAPGASMSMFLAGAALLRRQRPRTSR